jgi:hypothetical protein
MGGPHDNAGLPAVPVVLDERRELQVHIPTIPTRTRDLAAALDDFECFSERHGF